MKYPNYLFAIILLTIGCQSQPETDIPQGKLFTRLTPQQTGIHFTNELEDSEDFDVFRYRNYYNGGGVAIGDINNDGLPDIFLTANRGQNKLYLNQGDMRFEDITDKAGVAGTKPWSTGVTMVDINGDGLLDIYVCNSGDLEGNNMENELFVNNGDGTFTEKAAEYGLADPGFSTHAVFFDYDGDGDLDCYLLNNSFRPISTLGFRNLRTQRDAKGGDKLYKNEKGKFIDVSEEAGIHGSVIGFGLGVSVGDVTGNGHPDIFISNDFYERDYLYINQGDGTFQEALPDYMQHISMFSMGADIADINNDGYPEIFTTDMMPESDRRLKTMAQFETYDVLQLRLQQDYFYQYMRNTLQLNNAGQNFSEIGYLANVAATDWSWGALIADFNNNGNKEIFVSNGVYKDVTNQDFVEYLASNENMKAAVEGKKVNFQDFVNRMPSEKLTNYMFTQKAKLQFENVADDWGFGEPTFSNGAAYGDLDGDGDLDLVINNLNQELYIYKNNTVETQPDNKFLTFTFEGEGQNSFGLGAKVQAYAGNEVISFENMPIRGFQSSMDYKMVMGLGDFIPDSVLVHWRNGKVQKLTDLELNSHYHLKQADADDREWNSREAEPLFLEGPRVDFQHVENPFNDFDRERLTFKMLSTEGPAFAVADLNGDGLEDFFVGGAKDQEGAVFLQTSEGEFLQTGQKFASHSGSEDVSALFFDADNDGKLDLLVVSGGSEFSSNSPQLRDRLYLNKGLDAKGHPIFEHAEDALPNTFQIGSKAVAFDFNGNGHQDLLIASRKSNQYYGLNPTHQLLINDGNGNFQDKTRENGQVLRDIGMLTDLALFEHGGKTKILAVGDWNSIKLLSVEDQTLVSEELKIEGIDNTDGWWNSITLADLNKDGKMDIILTNTGLNTRLKTSPENPISLYVNDFDNNGSYEQITTYHQNGRDLPIHTRHDVVKQMSSLKKKFQTYDSYAEKSMEEIFDDKQLSRAKVLRSFISESVVLMSRGNDSYSMEILPLAAQFTTMRSAEVMDVNHDGHLDIIMAGNLYGVKPELGRYDASDGVVLLGDGKGNFVPQNFTGFKVPGETRHLRKLQSTSPKLIAVRNNNTPLVFKLN
ncbi:VCBS repeat-containing protein [Litoribacter alkaliphilus]|uniref:VCBS repeat-containing protein n=1 Tax=Litoribacter ruber TaxID=702568 RepID=A0AAP2CHN1_9BACT|nr:VCBS repeat-containing protein [Litoribacter alkaliphilus]MBS9523990.1 VCBS repeat-containing protein [Litoribacter alkaliphilus]